MIVCVGCVSSAVTARFVVQGKYAAGTGTYARDGYVYASIVGRQHTSTDAPQVRQHTAEHSCTNVNTDLRWRCLCQQCAHRLASYLGGTSASKCSSTGPKSPDALTKEQASSRVSKVAAFKLCLTVQDYRLMQQTVSGLGMQQQPVCLLFSRALVIVCCSLHSATSCCSKHTALRSGLRDALVGC
jgi:hypothetical protein